MEKIILEELVKFNNCYGKLYEKIDNLDKKLDVKTQKLDEKIDTIDKKYDKKIRELDDKIILTRDAILEQFGKTLDIIDGIILKTKNEILDKFEEQNNKNEIRFQKIEEDIVVLNKRIS